MEITLHMLPTDERDRALGRYMDAFSRVEFMIDRMIQEMLSADWHAGRALSSVMYSHQRIKLLEALAAIRLPEEMAKRVAKQCVRLASRNMRRNHIVHGSWTQFVIVNDDSYSMEWVRNYTPADPTLAAINDFLDPKLLGTYTFTIPALDKATGHVEEMFETLSPLLKEIHELLLPQRPPSDTPENSEQDQP
jgi:hypothetical protein